jgi:hypothetical protein
MYVWRSSRKIKCVVEAATKGIDLVASVAWDRARGGLGGVWTGVLVTKRGIHHPENWVESGVPGGTTSLRRTAKRFDQIDTMHVQNSLMITTIIV